MVDPTKQLGNVPGIVCEVEVLGGEFHLAILRGIWLK